MPPDNSIHIKLRLFDQSMDKFLEFGKYNNLMLSDVSPEVLVKDIKQTFNKGIKQFEIEVNNLKRGEV